MQDEIAHLKEENNRLRLLCNKQQDEIVTLNEYADAVDALRDIGKVIGCDHVDGPDGRRQLVNCVEQVFNNETATNDRLRALCAAVVRHHDERPPASMGRLPPHIVDPLREVL